MAGEHYMFSNERINQSINSSINQSMKDWLIIVRLPVAYWSRDKMTVLIFLFLSLVHALVLATNHIFVIHPVFTLSKRDLFSSVSYSSSLASVTHLPSSSSQMLLASKLENKLFFSFSFFIDEIWGKKGGFPVFRSYDFPL